MVALRVREVGKVESKTEELGRTRHGPTPAQLEIQGCDASFVHLLLRSIIASWISLTLNSTFSSV
jgi:hypothetical protein